MSYAITRLRGERYLSLETFKRDGTGVKTPVWFVEVAGKLYVVTDGETYKVKRARRNKSAKVAACNMVGSAITSPWFDATVDVVADEVERDAAYAALRAKYGFQMRLLDLRSKLRGRYERRAYLRIRV